MNRNMVSTTVTLLLAMLLSACSDRPSMKEADTYLLAQAQQVKINSYRDSLLHAKEGLTQVIPPLKNPNPVAPTRLSPELAKFLLENDCMTAEDFKYCYHLTRLRLIGTSKMLDEANDKIYAGQVTINGLIDNIDAVVQGIGDLK
ncbi:hypothetical protein RISINGSUN_95 [Erwinia phage vB_EamM_RisingSun]|uniref:Lipoprotein n=2 Tax=Risingsunvirus risingsun TaxID=2560435 RepID=A0A223LHX8_9CAUD|nr:hypothetical protein FDI45_gp095 [Erwinia phage vB_EamM_RisingSun]ASU03575.1 hypothetical protein RISINGSUN_95 [Erwinia phage vB_EamM_RisingSun]ASU03820.1 hypothetical protein JOAD_95 [Erwinia phage vB_EamM_Joad]